MTNFIFSDEEGSLKILYNKIKACIEQASEEICVIVDNISMLFDSASNAINVLNWLHYCLALVKKSQV